MKERYKSLYWIYQKVLFFILVNAGKANTKFIYTTSTSWYRRGLKRVPRSDLDKLIQRAVLPTCAGTILLPVLILRRFTEI